MVKSNPVVLLMDASQLTRVALMEALGCYNFSRFLEAGSLKDGLVCLRSVKPPDLLVLHPPFPDADTEGALSALRKEGQSIPMMVIGDVAPGVHLECMSKPLRLVDMVSRLHGMVQEFADRKDIVLSFDTFHFYPSSQLLESSSGEKVQLTNMEAGILGYLHKANEKTISREELLLEIWGYSANVHTHTLATHIHRLRQKIEKDPSSPVILLTRRNGYVLLRSSFL